MELREYWKL